MIAKMNNVSKCIKTIMYKSYLIKGHIKDIVNVFSKCIVQKINADENEESLKN